MTKNTQFILETLKQARLDRGRTLEDVAKAIEVSEGYISFMERHKRQPSLDVLTKYARELGYYVTLERRSNR